MLKTKTFVHMAKQHPRRNRETGVGFRVLEDAFVIEIIREDDVLYFTCELHAIIEVQEEFHAEGHEVF